jgi:hypothetical protein
MNAALLQMVLQARSTASAFFAFFMFIIPRPLDMQR